jgi:hypothetical protein
MNTEYKLSPYLLVFVEFALRKPEFIIFLNIELLDILEVNKIPTRKYIEIIF